MTITQAEYRTARECFEQGNLKIATFVRRDIWDIREDRKSLRKELQRREATEKELPADDIDDIANHASKFVNDAGVIFDFIREVARVDEMKSASPPKLPRGNWVHPFSDFRDITNALQPHVVGPHRVRRVVVASNLQAELAYIAAPFLQKAPGNGHPFPWHRYANEARKHINLIGCDMGQDSEIPNRALPGLWHWTIGPRAPVEGSVVLNHALSSGEFYSYDKEKEMFVATPAHRSIQELIWQLQRVTVCHKHATTEFPGENGYSPHMRINTIVERAEKNRTSASIRNGLLVVSFQLQDSHFNVLSLIRHLNLCFTTGDLHAPPPALRPHSPRHEKDHQPFVSSEVALSWLEKDG